MNKLFHRINLGAYQIADQGVRASNSHFPKESNQTTYAIGDEEAARILQGEDESGHSAAAEVVSCQAYLNVGVVVQKLDESVATVQAASDSVSDAVHHLVVFAKAFDLTFYVFEDNSESPNNRQQEAAKSQ